ncbi:protein of unknown function [Petrocella atlantisensis]|uniref:Uncharacterized protein n=1 Tax=Petrocella atlantisensis TaxID=2173034 RepID=A0A3P7RV80_9FIRM|nr:hypothetical protein [Petrocella atlantisensis]VDN46696.1 protein of unknown function [Petrocella atlantisensis]
MEVMRGQERLLLLQNPKLLLESTTGGTMPVTAGILNNLFVTTVTRELVRAHVIGSTGCDGINSFDLLKRKMIGINEIYSIS